MTGDSNDPLSFLSERARTHGRFSGVAGCTQQLKEIMRGCPSWGRMSPSQREGAEMVAHKLCRILNGNPDHLDHWHDLGGYSVRVAEEIRHATATTETTHQTLRTAIAARQREWDPESRLTPAYHALELGGEIGELLNVIKKQERARLELSGSTASEEQLREELGDVLTCVYLLANALGIDVEAEARKKFNQRSEQLGFVTRVEP
jgi:NTP pyrophosphatase (non-canonical NTP hydrolase)